ncbi:prephenate dehydratase [Yaniella flava]|uniref:Prephenate dehydratase n=1 Tax=Yaniella flava TaxID=287930 RepID=A0ABN2UR67_9MICC|nr:prephenate dehydratase [Micrococcaceae bacterium]
MKSYAYLGPEGTFTEAALQRVPEAREAEKVAAGSVIAALNQVRSGDVEAAVVPIENSVEGGVSATLDEIANGEELYIVGEVLVPISFMLVGRPDRPQQLDQLRSVATHTHAWAQVRGWAQTHIPDAEFAQASSTAAGARGLLDDATTYDAAVCAPHLARSLDLPILAEGIEDTTGAVTRFVVVARPGRLPERTGADKSSLVVPLPEDHPGALVQIMNQFATRGVNLTRIESRPTGEYLGKYFFSIDLEGHLGEERVGAALAALYRMFPGVRFMGSYPRAEHSPTSIPAYTTDDAYQRGRAWVQNILDR